MRSQIARSLNRTKMPFFRSAEQRLFYRWDGQEEGPVLVLSHSLGATHQMWDSQVPSFSRRFRVLRYDHRGHGKSALPEGPWTIADFGRDLLELLDYLELDQVQFCGLSLGGMLGLWLGEEAPDRVGKLILANCSAKIEDPSLLRGRMAQIREEGLKSITDNVMEHWFTPEFRAAHPEKFAEIRKMLLEASPEAYLATCDAICAMDLTAKLSQVQNPALVIYGKLDQATPPEWTQACAAELPNAEVLGLDSAHLSNVEASAKFNSSVLSFLK